MRPQTPGRLAPQRLERVLQYVELHLAETVTVRDLAQAACLSPFHFTRSFKRATGEAPHHFLMMRRLERAKTLLATTRLPIAQVAWSSGFRSHAHFTGVFTRRVGCTPTAWRASQRQAAAPQVSESCAPRIAPYTACASTVVSGVR
jgi:AraC family transcriptional regulator